MEQAESKVLDAYLLSFVSAANAGNFEMLITLYTHGIIVSGTLIGVGKYEKALIEQLKSTGEAGEIIAEKITKVLNDVLQTIGEDVMETSLPNFIHLKDAKIYTPGQPPLPYIDGMYWRGYIEAIDGWNFGQFGTSEGQ